jgi:hypothetical protein
MVCRGIIIESNKCRHTYAYVRQKWTLLIGQVTILPSNKKNLCVGLVRHANNDRTCRFGLVPILYINTDWDHGFLI